MQDLLNRANHQCELCEGTSGLVARQVPPSSEEILVCEICNTQMDGELDASHWHCLQGSAWSEVPAVQVASYRLLKRLTSQSWAVDLLDQMYLDETTQAWADDLPEATVKTVDCNGTELLTGDSVTIIKDLNVKGANFTAKRGTLVKNIRLSDDPGLVEGKVNKTSIYLKTEFIKKA